MEGRHQIKRCSTSVVEAAAAAVASAIAATSQNWFQTRGHRLASRAQLFRLGRDEVGAGHDLVFARILDADPACVALIVPLIV